MFSLFTKILGTKSDRDLKALRPIIQKIDAAFDKLQGISDDALRQAVQPIRDHIAQQTQAVEKERAQLTIQEKKNDEIAVEDSAQWLENLEKLKKRYKACLEKALNDMLPLGFAIMRETARRLAQHKTLSVTATPFDQEIAARSSYVTIEGEQAIWSNQWEAAGNPIVWDMAYYDVQIIGGIILHQGKIAEMATGEGKTLVATLPAFLNALAKQGVHIITVNDYLAKRDAAWMAPLFEFHGLRVDCIDQHAPHSPGRQHAYQADITYGTNNEFGFDYLRDNMATSLEELVQREPHFAMIDEVDSVLIDDARTPLIISGPVENSNEKEYQLFQPRILQLYNQQKALISQFLQEAKKQLKAGKEEEGGLALFRAYRGLPKHKPLVEYLSETGIKQAMIKVENYHLQDNARMMPEADEPLFFVIEERNNSVELTEKGIEYITKAGEDTDFFVLPDIGLALASLSGQFDSEEEELAAKEALAQDYNTKTQRIHVVQQLLKAYTLYEKDVEYIVADDRVKLVDEQTGRVLEGRRYSDGLHQALEAKEGAKIEKASQTYATITLQNYFRMYHKLAGMTGTAITEAGEFWDIYQLDVVVAPTHKPVIREDRDDKVYKTAREKFNAVIEEVIQLSQQGRPVLVGTTSVEISELVSRMLSARKIKHQVLNAKHHQREAEIVAEAGKAGTVTIATNMAGRGTDIKLSPEARQAGGLAIIGTERHESRRVDRQLRGRSGRQGDVGSSQFFVSLEDSLMRLFGSERIARIMDSMGLEEGEVIQHSLITKSIERAQKKVEQNNFAVRKRLLEYDNVMNSQRSVIYQRRKDALIGTHLALDVMNMLYNTVGTLTHATPTTDPEATYNIPALYSIFGKEAGTHIAKKAATLASTASPHQALYKAAQALYHTRTQVLKNNALHTAKLGHSHGQEAGTIVATVLKDTEKLMVNTTVDACITSAGAASLRSIEKAAILHYIDKCWKEHLRDMDQLRQAVQNVAYERRDPLLIYNFEAYDLFKTLCNTIDQKTITFLYQYQPYLEYHNDIIESLATTSYSHLEEDKPDLNALLDSDATQAHKRSVAPQPRQAEKVTPRNERITVQYQDGTIKRDVKFKNVEEDLRKKNCIRIQA